jgi:hypothetical protein
MNIIEAIKSGRRFRRKGLDDYMFVDSDYFLNNLDSIKREFLSADDWEIESAPVMITREQFDAAFEKALDDSAIKGLDCLALHHCLTKELGL